MRIKRPVIITRISDRRRRATRSPVPDPGPSERRVNDKPDLSWDCAVRVAAARLHEPQCLADFPEHPVVMELAQRLAALVCAYGKLPEESERFVARTGRVSVTETDSSGT